MKPLRFGLIGTGNIADTHARALAESDLGTLVAAAGGRRVEAFCRVHGCAAAPDAEALLARDDVDAVLLCTPSGARRDLAVAAAEAGKHVLAEKPLEVSVARGTAMVDACEAHGVQLGVIFQSRFKPACEAVRAAVTDGHLGTIVEADAHVKWQRPPSYYADVAWRGTWALDGGGALMNQGIHAVDQLLWWLGDVAEVSARTARRGHTGIEVEDTLVAHLVFASGALGTIVASTAIHPGWERRSEVCGTAGSVRLEDDRVTAWELADGADAPVANAGPASGSSGSAAIGDAEPHRRQIEDFIAAVHDGRAPRVDGREGLRSVALVEAAYRSAREGAPAQPEGR